MQLPPFLTVNISQETYQSLYITFFSSKNHLNYCTIKSRPDYFLCFRNPDDGPQMRMCHV